MTPLTLVTGAAGHVGANLSRALLARGRRLRLLVRADTRAVTGLDAELVRADLLDGEALERALAGVEVVYNAAAQISIDGDPDGLLERVNVEGPRNLVDACLRRGVRRLVHFSSVHALSPQPLDQVLDEQRAPVDGEAPAYNRSKASGERVVLSAAARGLEVLVVSPTAVLGPHDYKPSRMGEVLLRLARRRVPALVAGGVDWVDVEDVCAGAIAAEERGRPGERYLLSGHWLSLSGLAELVAEVSGTPSPAWVAPHWLARLGLPLVAGWSRLSRSAPLFTDEALQALRGPRRISHAKATRELGFEPRPLRQTVETTYRWFKDTGRL